MKRLAWIWILLLPALALAKPHNGGPIAEDGTEIICDLPKSQMLHNKGGRDGLGLCVFTSLNMAGNWQHVEALRNFRDQMTRERGGGWPEKVDRMIAKYAPGVKYIQVTGDVGILELALKTGRMPAVTYGPDHMVCLAHLDKKHCVFLDNNDPDPAHYKWYSREEGIRKMGGNHLWGVVLLDPGPPPPPHNTARPVAPKELKIVIRPRKPRHPKTPRRPRPKPAHGVYWRPWGETYAINGVTVPRSAAVEALRNKATLPDDSAKLRLTAIGSAEAIKQVVADAARAGNVITQGFRPEDWQVTQAGFKANPAGVEVYLQKPDGQVLHRQDGYRGVQDLEVVLRRVNPDYRPDADPDLRVNPAPSPLPSLPDLSEITDVHVGAVALTLLGLLSLYRFAVPKVKS